MAYREHYLHVPGSGLIERMNLELNLTPAQRDQIGDILRDTRFKVMKSRQDFDHQRHTLFWQGLGQVRGVLTPDQQKIFDRDFTHPWEHHGHDGHYGDDADDHEGGAPPPPASPN